MLYDLHCFVPSDVENRVSDFLVYSFSSDRSLCERTGSTLSNVVFMLLKI